MSSKTYHKSPAGAPFRYSCEKVSQFLWKGCPIARGRTFHMFSNSNISIDCGWFLLRFWRSSGRLPLANPSKGEFHRMKCANNPVFTNRSYGTGYRVLLGSCVRARDGSAHRGQPPHTPRRLHSPHTIQKSTPHYSTLTPH